MGEKLSMKVGIFGANGMLGKYVTKYLLNCNYDVTSITRDIMDLFTVNDAYFDYFIKSSNYDVIINCAGIIKPRIKDVGIQQTIKINSLFPHMLSNLCRKFGRRCVHITTDCVFSGDNGYYIESDIHDAEDLYGKSKSLGEPKNCAVIRTSIIGEELNQSRSLLEWVKSQKSGKCHGFTNHYWNGVTCLELAKLIEEYIQDEDAEWNGVWHVHSPESINKYELLCLINNVYGLNIKITPIKGSTYCNRILSSEFPKKSIYTSLEDQIKEMKNFKL
jgi:dTDP-4-dehydrorhamnose reductase